MEMLQLFVCLLLVVFTRSQFAPGVPPPNANKPNINNNQHISAPPHGQRHANAEQNMDSMIMDRQHINEHADGQFTVDQNMLTDKEMQFHFFKQHDYDQNNLLDGIELASSLTHVHRDPTSREFSPPTNKIFSDNELIAFVDQILNKEDTNFDGYIDYAEFAQSRRIGQ